MPPEKKDIGYLWDILEAARLVKSFIAGVDEKALVGDPMRQSAVIRQLEIIGEATTRLSEDFRKRHSAVEWRKMVGLRNILIHAYDQIILDVVWEIATESVPELIAYIEPLLPEEPKDE